jgi:hypothetical protein
MFDCVCVVDNDDDGDVAIDDAAGGDDGARSLLAVSLEARESRT